MIGRIHILFTVLMCMGCSPLVGAMIDKPPKDASTDTHQEVIPYCEESNPCPDGFFCMKQPCEASIGICKRIPDNCEGEPVDPVCGCNDMDYRNECEMILARQSKKHDGACISAQCTSTNRRGCGAGNYCEGFCGDTEGECYPNRCPGEDIIMVMCGCLEDGTTVTFHSNCERIEARAWFAHEGECGSAVCYEDDPEGFCGFDEFCEGPAESCGMMVMGTCVPRPDYCDLSWEPVCGCDNNTHPNDCERQKAGVWLKHQGECWGDIEMCAVDPRSGIVISPCPLGKFCEFPLGECPDTYAPDLTERWGMCVDPGNCEEPPLPCSLDDADTRVCACGQRNYPDDCLRRHDEISVLCCGPCEECPPVF